MNESIDIVAQENWDKVKKFYLSTLSSPDERNQVARYFSTITSVAYADDVFSITFSNSYTADFIRDKYADKLKMGLDLVFSKPITRLEFRHEEKKQETWV